MNGPKSNIRRGNQIADTQRKGPMKTQGEGGHLQGKGSGLSGKQPSEALIQVFQPPWLWCFVTATPAN